MKNLIIFSLCSFMAMQTYGQTPNFLFSLKARNAQGFKDSAVIGTTFFNVEDNNTFGDPIPGFDGPNLSAIPADNNMDLRVAYMFNYNYKTKKRIVPSLCSIPLTSPLSRLVQVVIYIHSKKWPVVLSWDSTLFANTYCVNKSFFSRTSPSSTPEPDSINPEYFPWPILMAASHGSLRLDSTLFVSLFQNAWLWNENQITLNNGNQGQYYSIALYLNRRLGGGPIRPGGGWPGVSVKPKKQFSLKIYPNPVDNQFTIEHNLLLGKTMIVKILNMQGQMVDSRSISRAANSHTIHTSHLPAGMYMVQMQESGGGVVSRGTFVKL